MTKFNTNSIIYTLSLILLVGVLAFSVALTCVRSTQNAYADYETDILNNPQAIVNFNQLFNNTISRGNYNTISISKNNATYNVNGYFTGYSLNLAFNETAPSINIYANHIYYLDFKLKVNSGSIPNLRLFTTNGGVINVGNIKQLINPSADSTVSVGFQVLPGQNSSSNPYNFSVTPMLIDLTQMFGSGNEPNLQQCNDLFVSDYYPYSTGSALSRETFTSYAQGVESVLQGMTTTIGTPTIIRTAQPYYGFYQNSKIVYYTNTGNYPETLLTDDFKFMNSAYVPFMTTLDSNVSLNISAFSIADINIENFILAIYLLSSDNNLILVDTIQSDSIVTNYSFDVVIPTTCEGVVFSVLTEGRTNQYINLSELEFTYNSNNLTNLLASANESGYNRAKTYYDDYYGEYGSGYQEIFDLGYSTGINAQATDFSNTYYTIPQFLGALIDVPVKVLTSLLDFDVFGFNLKNLVFSLITLAIVFAIVRLILMKTGDNK